MIAARLAACLYGGMVFLAYYTRGQVGPLDYYRCGLLAAMVFPALYLPYALFRAVTRGRHKRDGLDKVLFRWNGRDAFTVRDLLTSICILGQISSGKSSGSGLLLARGILGIPSGVLVLASKPEDRDWWIERCREAGRLDDLIVFAPDTSWRSNYLEYLMGLGADAREIVEFLQISAEILSSGKGGDNEQFWRLSQQRLLYNAISALRHGLGTVDAPSLHAFVTDCANKPEDLVDEKWRARFHATVLDAAFHAVVREQEQADKEVYSAYFLNEVPNLDERVRNNVLAGVVNLLQTYVTGVVHSAISTSTSFTPDDLLAGKVIIADYSYHFFGKSGQFIMAATKYLTQKMILRRRVAADDIPIVVWADECQGVYNSFDASFLAECRSHRGCMIYLTQSIHSFTTKAE
jgi:hypothetical protein